jgi:DNA replication protein DnaC
MVRQITEAMGQAALTRAAAIRRPRRNGSRQSESPDGAPSVCSTCGGCGYETVYIGSDGQRVRPERTREGGILIPPHLYTAVAECGCLRRKRARFLLDSIPPRYRKATLYNLKPDPNCHALQADMIADLKAYPNDSYLLAGKHGSGKSHFGWCLARYAIGQRRKLIHKNLEDLLNEYRAMEIPERNEDGSLKYFRAGVTAEDLQIKGARYCLFLQEFDKPKPSEYASKTLFNLIDAAYNYNQQVIITSNQKLDDLASHWSRYGAAYGAGIARRIAEMCAVVEMF